MVKKIYFSVLTSIIALAGLNNGYTQDVHYSQFYANPLFLNPAFAGAPICPRLIMNYRNQWPSISGTYVTYNGSYDQNVDFLHGGIGVLVNSDKAGEGVLTTTEFSGIYSYNLNVSSGFSVKAGFQATYFDRHLDREKLAFGDQIDPKYGFVYNTLEDIKNDQISGADFSAGILGYSETVFLGFAAHHLTRPNISFMNDAGGTLPMKFTLHGGAVIKLNGGGRRSLEDPILSPNILFMQQQDFQQINYGIYLNRYPVIGGLWFRQSIGKEGNPDALIILLGIQTSVLKFGYSYDVTVSKLSTASGGSHEFSCAFQFACKPKKKKIRPINCPAF